ncbi:putative p-loop containing nucleoside triphosphate hydrolase [Golovinomyces cichoracearum]|uniref:ubiquitinyl hydrolase 1 n=1 Tax=Golovinomyces cichoracearum TaxID=62708 RepID=A0A420J0X6_9PEZI|nr:putative p-loop containing nucleoside triphosphate hydrolase [Golovinomyces cichoracearum]
MYDKLTTQNWTNINEQDEAQVNELWKYLCRSINTVNFFLNKFVFPRHAKQFTYKLQASGWDIPLYDFNTKTQGINTNITRTTGFSGTNDWKRLLPLTISQQDLPGLSHTNAEVITYLLQRRNSSYTCTADIGGKPPSEVDLLQKINSLGKTILIDAGAQIMEMDNLSLVTKWLEINQHAPAAFFFHKENGPQILYRNGRKVSFYSSPYADNLKDCLVYFDQVHTRGTDLKLPSDAKAVLTLGPNQTKDHTVQAAMRLRQLGSTQSVHFFAPLEVHQSILSVQGKTHNDRLTSLDVIAWLLKQTCTGIEFLLPLYSLQGYDFCRRAQAALTHSNLFGTDDAERQKFFSVIRPEEDLNIEDIYGMKKRRKLLSFSDSEPAIGSILKQLRTQSEGYMESGNCHYSTALQEVEQEREVANEIQVIEQKQKPVHYKPLNFKGIHPHILEFIDTGKVRSVSSGYELAFEFISRTIIGRKYSVNRRAFSPKLFVSIEFDRTVKEGSQIRTDHLHRPVHWILWSEVSEVALVIIPEEVELIIPMLREKPCSVHLLTYAAPTTQKMLEFNDFDHYNIPQLPSSWRAPLWLRIETGILAKRLYFDYSEYSALVKFLGVEDREGKVIENDNNEFPEIPSIITPQTHDSSIGFTSKPLCFLQDWLALRGEGQEFILTPMGYICQGRPILPQFSFCSRIKCTTTTTSIPTEDENQKELTLNFTKNATQQDETDDLISFDPVQSIPGQENETEFCEEEEGILDLLSDLNLQ